MAVFIDKHGWSGSTLKIIAAVTMLIDHIGAGIIEPCLEKGMFTGRYAQMLLVDDIMRGIGRIAFPIYCFLLVEGYLHTRNVWKYFLRMCIFGVASEMLFDLCFFEKAVYQGHQNVFFTLALGILLMKLLDRINEIRLAEKIFTVNATIKVLMSLGAIILIGATAILFNTDYNMRGITTIAIMYILRSTKFKQLVGDSLSCLIVLEEPAALGSLLPVAMYNGKRGLKLKYFFYVFYPAHLLLIFIAQFVVGIR